MDEVLLNEKTWGIPDSRCCQGMHGVLSGINTLTIFPKSSKETSIDENTARKMKLYRIKKISTVLEKYQRKLINETAGIFLSLQSSIQLEEDNKAVIIQKSREYRSVIQLCIMEMKELVEGSGKTNDENNSEITSTYNLLYKMEVILCLVEIIYIDTRPGGGLLSQLLNWVRLHFTQYKTRMAEILALDTPYLDSLYWDVCYSMVLQGQLEDVRILLSRHPNFENDPFLSIDELLRKMPSFQMYGGVTVQEFMVRWIHWQNECKTRLERGEFASIKQLQTIAKILCGDEETISSLTDIMETWYHLMVSTLLYTNPTVQKYSLHAAAQDAIALMDSEPQIGSLDHVLLTITEGDPGQVIKLCQQVLDNSWFTSHLADLLYHTMAKKVEYKYLQDIREFLILDFGSELISHPSLWQVGILYIEASGGPQGRAMVETILQRIPLTDDSKAQKIIQMATDRGFDHVAVSICRVMGRRALSEGKLGAAIWWGVRSRDAAFTSHLAHQILHKYVNEREFESSSLLDNLGASMLLSDTLTFLGKYREFHSLYQDENYSDAASLLVSLISSKLAPEYFWPVLLVDSLPLLQYSTPVISADQTYQLMYCLHNLKDTQSKDSIQNNGAMSSFKEKEKEIRQALTTNLARAIVEEGSVEE